MSQAVTMGLLAELPRLVERMDSLSRMKTVLGDTSVHVDKVERRLDAVQQHAIQLEDWVRGLHSHYDALTVQLQAACARIAELEQSLADINQHAIGHEAWTRGIHGHVEQLIAFRNRSQQQRVTWTEALAYEASVNLAIRDLVSPGDVCFDIGSHTGMLSMVLSRLCGPRGTVCAFEANSHNVREALANLAFNNCHNVFTVNRCVWQRTGAALKFHLPNGEKESQSGGLYHGQGHHAITVTTVALDDFVAATGLTPILVKMDIEGAEHDALMGMRHTLEHTRPHVILDQSREHGDSCFQLLRHLGYVAIDLHNYHFVEGCGDFPPKAVVRNVLFIHRSRLDATPYSLDMRIGSPESSGETTETKSGDGRRNQTWKAQLGKGRYVFAADLRTDDGESPFELRGRVGGTLQVLYGGSPKWVADSYADFILDVPEPALVEVEARELTPAATVQLAGVTYAPVLGLRSTPQNFFC